MPIRLLHKLVTSATQHVKSISIDLPKGFPVQPHVNERWVKDAVNGQQEICFHQTATGHTHAAPKKTGTARRA